MRVFPLLLLLATAPLAALSEGAAAYLDEALAHMEAQSLHREAINWEELRAEAYATADTAVYPADTYPAIRQALERLGDNHSCLLGAEAGSRMRGSRDRSVEGITECSEMLAGGIGYLFLPPFLSYNWKEYVNRLFDQIKALSQQEAWGWIVDLRGNRGGNMFPMLVGMSPLLGEGSYLLFIDQTGITDRYDP